MHWGLWSDHFVKKYRVNSDFLSVISPKDLLQNLTYSSCLYELKKMSWFFLIKVFNKCVKSLFFKKDALRSKRVS